MTRPFRDALNDAIKSSGWSLRYVAGVSGVSYDQLKKLSQGRSRSTNVDDAIRIAHAFGVTLDEFLDDRTVSDRAEAVALWRQLSEEERDLLRAAARGRAAQAREGER